MSGTVVAWDDDRTGNRDIFVRDLVTGQETRVTENRGNNRFPDLWGDVVVYQSDRSGNLDIYAFDLTNGVERQITAGSNDETSPRIHDDVIVYEAWVGGERSVRRFNLATGGDALVGGALALQPEISENWIVWVGAVSGVGEVFAMNRQTSCVHRVTTGAGAQRPAVGTDHVAFEVRSTAGEAPMDVVNLRTRSRVRVSAYITLNADISGSLVVWSDRRYDDPSTQVAEFEIMAYNLSANLAFPLTSDMFPQVTPSISGNRVVWAGTESQDVSDDLDIYVLEIDP